MSPPAITELQPDRVRTVLCDLDGVVWLAHEPIPAAVAAIAAIRASGRRVLFVTNNSSPRVVEQETALAAIGVPAVGDVVTSARAAATLVAPGERVLVAAGPGVVEAIGSAGAEAIVNDGTEVPGPVDVVVVGLHRDFDYARLAIATAALRRGARLIATNDDATYPTARGPEPGGGSILAAVATAGGATPTIAGKPHPPMAALIGDLLGSPSAPFDPTTAVMVGDRPETDGLFAATLGCPFVLVRSGVLAPDDPSPEGIEVAVDVADLGGLADLLGEPAADHG